MNEVVLEVVLRWKGQKKTWNYVKLLWINFAILGYLSLWTPFFHLILYKDVTETQNDMR